MRCHSAGISPGRCRGAGDRLGRAETDATGHRAEGRRAQAAVTGQRRARNGADSTREEDGAGPVGH
jgi:hypothetical protein